MNKRFSATIKSKITLSGWCLLTVSILVACTLSCARKGLVSEAYEESFYHVPNLLPDLSRETNPKFIVMGDVQASFLLNEKFVRKKNWATWKMLIFPFYQIYLVGNGVAGSINWVRKVPDYGHVERRMVRDAVYEEIQGTGADFILTVGDMAAYDGRRYEHWGLFLRENRVESPLLNEIPYLPVSGNHDRTNDPVNGKSNFEAIFSYPRFYTVTFANAALFVIDSNYILDQYQHIEDKEQEALFERWFVSGKNDGSEAWLEKELALCDKPYKIIASHHPLFPFGRHQGNWSNSKYGVNLKEKRRRLLNLFLQEGVQVVLSGHEHIYTHSVLEAPRSADGTSPAIHFIVSSGGGAAIRDLHDKETIKKYEGEYKSEGYDVSLVKQASAYHYSMVEISEKGIRINTVEVADRGEVRKTLEEVVIDK